MNYPSYDHTFDSHARAIIDLDTAIVKQPQYSRNEVTLYHALGLCGEAGEVAELIKKQVRGGFIDLGKLSSELGDVIWYWFMLCQIFGLDPSEVCKQNLRKLGERKKSGTIANRGDDNV